MYMRYETYAETELEWFWTIYGSSYANSNFSITTKDASAISGVDFLPINTTVNQAVNDTIIRAPIVDDNIYEGSETFMTTALRSDGETFPWTVTITDEEDKPILTASSVTTTEGSGFTYILLTASNAAAKNYDVNISYSGNINSSEYSITSSRVTFNAGETSKLISVNILDDELFESSNDYLNLNFSSSYSKTTGRINITDNDIDLTTLQKGLENVDSVAKKIFTAFDFPDYIEDSSESFIKNNPLAEKFTSSSFWKTNLSYTRDAVKILQPLAEAVGVVSEAYTAYQNAGIKSALTVGAKEILIATTAGYAGTIVGVGASIGVSMIPGGQFVAAPIGFFVSVSVNNKVEAYLRAELEQSSQHQAQYFLSAARGNSFESTLVASDTLGQQTQSQWEYNPQTGDFKWLVALDPVRRSILEAQLGFSSQPIVANGDTDPLSMADVMKGGYGDDNLHGLSGNDVVMGSYGNDNIYGDSGGDAISGDDGNDALYGGTGNDYINGGAGSDKLRGEAGADILYGGTGADIFIFSKVLESRLPTSSRDTITDFSVRSGDRINLSLIDANSKIAGNQAFKFIGSDKFHGTAGELRYEKTTGEKITVYADVNGDRKSDLSIIIENNSFLIKDYFIL